MSPMPVATPKRHGSPRRSPAFAPAAVTMTLLGPGVTAATTAKRRNARSCSVVVLCSPVALKETRSGGQGLERSCGDALGGWIASARPADGVELFRAWFSGRAYARHRHDTYAIGLTDCGVQVFDYRGAARVSLPGQVVVLYPDEAHDGRAGAADGFGYRIVYVEPAQLADALRTVRGRPGPLPFVREPVSTSARLGRAHDAAFRLPPEPLAADSLVVELAHGLLAAESARRFLDAERTRVVHSTELERVSGLSRYDLARQFRALLGTSPYRYLLMRRLDLARELIHRRRALAEVACEAGFADQAHFTRVFKAAFGLTPARYRALRAGQRV